MNIQINIDTCSDENNKESFFNHLEKIKKRYEEFEKDIEKTLDEGGCYKFEYNNCDGTHEVTCEY